MDASEGWRALFENWPESVERTGMLVTRYQETIPFTGFLISGGLLLVERDKPDSAGARKVMLPYDQIAAVKLSSPLELARFQVMGFQPPF
jgi:hypothetical protein